MPTLPAGTYQGASASYMDAGGERGTFHCYGKVITAANEVAQAAAWAVVLAALDALSLGARVRDAYNDITTYSAARPTNGAAREVALQIWFRDTVNGQTFQSRLPAVNIDIITYIDELGAKDIVDSSSTELGDLTDALNGFPVVNPYAQANTVVVAGYKVVRGNK